MGAVVLAAWIVRVQERLCRAIVSRWRPWQGGLVMMPVRAEDEVFHPAGEDPHWIETIWVSFQVPEHALNGWVYIWHDARSGISGGGPAVWDPTGEQDYDCLFYDWRWLQPRTGGLDYHDFRLPNSTRQQMREPLRCYHYSYDERGCSLELEWTAIGEPYEGEVGTTIAGSRHFAQPGHVTGAVTLKGEPDKRIEVDCGSMRDHTWGPNRPVATRSGDYLWAIASPSSMWHAVAVAGPTPGVDVLARGYLVRDGVRAELSSATRRVVERRSGVPVRVLFDAEDVRGRALHAEGTVHNVLRWFGWPGRMAFWTLTRWCWEDGEGWGENQEFWPIDQVRALLART